MRRSKQRKDLITISQAAMILGVSIVTLRRWDASGKFEADLRTLGGGRRYSKTRIEDFLRQQSSQEAKTHSTDEEVLTAADLSERLGVSLSTIKRWVRDGRIQPSGKTAQGWRYYLFTDVRCLLRSLSNKK